jgi:hypothetical protein
MRNPKPEEHDFDLKDLPDDSAVWRYMDIGKLLWTLSTSSLYFSSIAKLAANDPYEGVLPPAYHEEFRRKWPQLPNEVQKYLCDHTGRAFSQTVTSLDELIAVYRNQYGRLSQCTFVNCWYAGGLESAAMWTLYAARGSGIAIRTTAARLKKALKARNSGTEFVTRLVCYYDQTAQELPNLAEGINTVAFLKRYSYAHECEYRVAFEDLSTDDPQSGRTCECDLNELVERVVISPYEEEYIVSPINDLLKRYSLKCESGKSPLMKIS